MKWLSTPVILLLSISFFPIALGAAAQFDEETLDSLLTRQRYDEAIGMLEARLKDHPDEMPIRVRLGRILEHVGKRDAAIEALKKGLRNKKEDAELWWYIAGIATDQAKDGPGVIRSGGTVQYTASGQSDEEEAEWKRAKYDIAVGAYKKLLSYSPSHEESAENLAAILIERDSNVGPESKRALDNLAESFPENEQIAMAVARAFVRSGDNEKAEPALRDLIEKQPRNQSAYQMLAEVQEALGKKDEAAANRGRAQFYAWMPPFSTLSYSGELAATIAEIEKSAGDAAERLKAEPGKESSEMLAAICFRHIAHGPVENGCFHELEKRKESDLIVKLAQHGTSVCTLRESGRSLARLKHPEAYDFLSYMLPQDTRPTWIIDAARSLEILGDERAVNPLVEALDPIFKETDRQRSELDADFMGDGPLFARWRAALALGGFDTSESRKALEMGAKNKDIAISCHLALYRMTGEEKHLAAVKGGKVKDAILTMYAVEYLQRIGTPQAKELADEIEEQRKDRDGAAKGKSE